MRREKTQISRIRNAKGEITTITMEVQEIIRDYFENLYSRTQAGTRATLKELCVSWWNVLLMSC
jgi:hypothetical protein